MADYIYEEKCQKILDVGCNRGQLLKALDGWNGEIWGVDKDKEALNEIKNKYNKTYAMDIATDKVPFKEKFDCIVFGDILEHVVSPAQILDKFVKNLDKNGTIIISIPNVANWVIRFQLLLGNFNYKINGILDRTHLKFYTLKTITKIIDDYGLKILRIKTTPIPMPLLIKSTDYGKPLFFLHIINYAITKSRRTLFGYQFVFKCKKKA